MTDDALIDLLAAHRPYGIDCACGRPINSDRDWATHLAQMLTLTPVGAVQAAVVAAINALGSTLVGPSFVQVETSPISDDEIADLLRLNENLSSGSPSPSELKLLADEAERGYDPSQVVPTGRDRVNYLGRQK